MEHFGPSVVSIVPVHPTVCRGLW